MLCLAVGKHMYLQFLSFCPNVSNKQFSVQRGRLRLVFYLLFFLLFFSLSLLFLSFFLSSLSPPAWNIELELAVDFFLLLLGLVSGSLSSLSDLVTGADAYRIQSFFFAIKSGLSPFIWNIEAGSFLALAVFRLLSDSPLLSAEIKWSIKNEISQYFPLQ